MQALVFLYEAHMLPMWDWELEMRLIAESPPEYALIRFLLAFIVLSQLCISLIYAAPQVYQDYVDRDPAEPAEPRVRTVSHQPLYQPYSSEKYKPHIKQEIENPDPEVRRIVRLYRLRNECSHKLVQVVGFKIAANAEVNSEFVDLIVETDTFGSRVRIRSAWSNNYICLSKKGRLTVRHSGRSKKCVFQEHIAEDQNTEFQSVVNPFWYIGFRRNGRPLNGYQRKGIRRKCFKFVKTDFPYTEPKQNHGPGGDFKKLITQKSDKT